MYYLQSRAIQFIEKPMIYWLMQQKSDKIILKTIDIIF